MFLWRIYFTLAINNICLHLTGKSVKSLAVYSSWNKQIICDSDYTGRVPSEETVRTISVYFLCRITGISEFQIFAAWQSDHFNIVQRPS